MKRQQSADADDNHLTDGEPGRASPAQLRYLGHGMDQPGGKLPLFDKDGQEISVKTIRSCIERGWAEPWFENPVKPNWIVCRLTRSGRDLLDRAGGPDQA